MNRSERQARQQPECVPACPWCSTAKHVAPSGTSYRAFYCGRCRREFEPDDDGTIGYGRPEKRMEREENHKARTHTNGHHR